MNEDIKKIKKAMQLILESFQPELWLGKDVDEAEAILWKWIKEKEDNE